MQKTLVIMDGDGSSSPVAIEVDKVLTQVQVVLKPLEDDLKNHAELSGAAIMGDGTVALVLDVDGLISRVQLTSGAEISAS